ncbi:MAG: LytR/AlgR family response regulator transcription factor [Crocinitomicaceae bacterium]
MISAVIIDDEDHCRENLRTIINSNFNDIQIVGEGNSVESATKVITDTAPNVVFLDVDLSDGSGFNVLDNIESLNFHVIFITAFNDYAIKAFRYNALDYLLKPIDIEELKNAISKIQEVDNKQLITKEEVKELIANLSRTEEDKKLIIKDKNYNYYIRIGDIIRCEADGNYTTIYCENHDKIVVSYPLKKYVSLLPTSIFFRVHQSNLINLNQVKKVLKEDGGLVVMNDESKVLIARRRKDSFFEAMKTIIA